LAALSEFDIVAKRFEELGEEDSGIKNKNKIKKETKMERKEKNLENVINDLDLGCFYIIKTYCFYVLKAVFFNECIVHITDLALLYMCVLFVRQYRSLHAVKDIS
jgi:hypothetical protein